MGWLGKDRRINGLAGERSVRIELEGRAGISVSGKIDEPLSLSIVLCVREAIFAGSL